MADKTKYNIFIFLSNFARGLTSSFSVIILYKSNFSIKEIILFLCLNNLFSIIINYITVKISEKINNKLLILISTITYILTYYYLNNLNHTLTSFIIFNIILAISEFTYHPIRHKYAIYVCQNEQTKEISNIVILSYLALSPASLVGAYLIENVSITLTIIILLIISIISIIFLSNKKNINIKTTTNKNKYNIYFYIFEQFKIIFQTLIPLFLYINIESSIKYIGIINLFICLSSILFILIIKKKNIEIIFPYISIILTIILILKLNIRNKYIIIVLAFIEGICLKTYDIISTKNMYKNINKNINKFIIKTETIFCLTRFIIYLILYIFTENLKIILYICIIFIFISSFTYKTNK